MSNEYEVIYDRPFPCSITQPRGYPFSQMRFGACFDVPLRERKPASVQSHIGLAFERWKAEQGRMGAEIIIRPFGDGLGVWMVVER